MKSNSMQRVLFQSFLITAITTLSMVACSSKKTATDGAATETYAVDQEDIKSGRADSDSGNAMGLQTINFPFDSFELNGEANRRIQNNAGILKQNGSVNVQIEGHCDERGGIQYNLALGEKRANAIKRKLVAAGIAGSRIETISLGKEKPIAMGNTESDHEQNRRGNFVITSK
jgi:peptidoglycan-associated lipoprotein